LKVTALEQFYLTENPPRGEPNFFPGQQKKEGPKPGYETPPYGSTHKVEETFGLGTNTFPKKAPSIRETTPLSGERTNSRSNHRINPAEGQITPPLKKSFPEAIRE